MTRPDKEHRKIYYTEINGNEQAIWYWEPDGPPPTPDDVPDKILNTDEGDSLIHNDVEAEQYFKENSTFGFDGAQVLPKGFKWKVY